MIYTHLISGILPLTYGLFTVVYWFVSVCECVCGYVLEKVYILNVMQFNG